MRKTWIAVPHCVRLTDENAWKQEGKFEFSICRSHYLIYEYQIPGPTKLGEIVTSQNTPERTMDERVISVTLEHSILQVEETVKQIVTTDETIDATIQSLSSSVTPVIGKFDASLRRDLTRKLTNSLQNTNKVHTGITARACTTFSRKLQLKGERDGRRIDVAYGFQRHAYDIYLVYMDFLRVYYSRSPLGIRRTMRKWPQVNGADHSNLLAVRAPVGSIHFWQLLPELQTVDSTKYRMEVSDPFEIETHPVQRVRHPQVEHPRPDEPTLYQVSRATFPFKWIEREGPWTREELLAIEQEQAELDGSWWAWQDQPKRRKRKRFWQR
jgi:hypothetical protein